MSVEEYLDKVRQYLKDIINGLKKSDTWKIQLAITINFISSKADNDEEHVMIKVIKQKSRLVMKQMKVQKNSLIHLKTNIKIIYNQ